MSQAIISRCGRSPIFHNVPSHLHNVAWIMLSVIGGQKPAEQFASNLGRNRHVKNFKASLPVVGLALLLASGSSHALDIACDTDAPSGKNYMTVPDTQVSACLDAGVGNIGNGQNDLFLNGVGAGYSEIADTSDNANFDFIANGDGTWSFNADVWGDFATVAIGFKFGTGNTPDEWFVYQVIQDVVSGTFTFFDIAAPGGATPAERFSHAVLYAKDPITGDDDDDTDVPEPGSLALLGLGLIGLGMGRRRLAR
jgi:hypothetical protein